MGKRRTNAPHKDRYADSESNESESEYTQPELEPGQLATIKTRKKLIAKRRGPSDISSFGVFGSLTKADSTASDSTDSHPAPSVFSGFKGFSGFKAGPPDPVKSALANSSLFSSSTISSVNDVAKKSVFSSKPLDNISTTNKPLSNLFTSQATNGDHKISDTTISKDTATESPIEVEVTSNNINETELNFINELNVVYEKYYGKTKRVLKLPTEVLNQEMDSNDKQEDSKKKYGFLLAELNKHCSKWISKHVEENPLIVLTPIFVDYFNYMIIMEKNLYPNTFKGKNVNGTSTFSANQCKSTNGTNNTLSVTSASSTSVLSFNTSSNIVFNKKVDVNPKNVNGHKEDAQKLEFDQADKENEEADNDKKLSDSSKNFASLIKANQMNPISLANNNTTSTSFTVKPSSDMPKLSEKDSNSTTTTQTGMFKFGPPTTDSKIKSSFKTTDDSEIATEGSKIDSKSPTADKNAKETSSFKFGVTTTTTDSSAIKSATTSIFGKTESTSSPINTLFGKAASASTVFGSNTLGPKSSSFSKSTETKATMSAIFSKTETATPSMFPNLNKSSQMVDSDEPEKISTQSTEKVSATPSFSSLMNTNTSQTGSSTFKGFSGFGGTSGSLFSASVTPAATADSADASKPFFSFSSSAISNSTKPGLFGTGTTGSLFGASNSTTFPATATGSTVDQEEEEYVPPKPETSDVKEEGAVFEKRTKLFYFNEKESKFVDRGIGNLYIKPLNNGESTSLIIRADNKLANILLNVKLMKELPISKISAKDVSYLCIPNPPIPNVESTKPCKFLFKVKTEEDALELVEKLNEYKK